jgi:subtilisin
MGCRPLTLTLRRWPLSSRRAARRGAAPRSAGWLSRCCETSGSTSKGGRHGLTKTGMERRLRRGDVAAGARDRSAHRQELGMGRGLRRRDYRGGGRQRGRRCPPGRRRNRSGCRSAVGLGDRRGPEYRGPHDDLFGHGTACAGIIRRAAPEATMWSVRVLGSRLTGKGMVFAAGLRWAITQGARVVNLSLSTGARTTSGFSTRSPTKQRSPAPSWSALPTTFRRRPTLRSSPQSSPSPPMTGGIRSASMPTRRRRPTSERPASTSGCRGCPAPRFVSTGNSFAAPHVTGLVARLLSKHPDLTPYEVKTVLRAVASNAVAQGASDDD